jgi:hypothetical protein
MEQKVKQKAGQKAMQKKYFCFWAHYNDENNMFSSFSFTVDAVAESDVIDKILTDRKLAEYFIEDFLRFDSDERELEFYKHLEKLEDKHYWRKMYNLVEDNTTISLVDTIYNII